MESPSRALTLSPPSSSNRWCISRDSVNSPEFEFSNAWSNSQTTLHSADELFSHGFLLPLQLLHLNRSDNDDEPGSNEPDPEASSALITSSSSSSNSILSASKRWREIFKRTEKKPEIISNKNVKGEKKREKEKKNNSNSNSTTAELNINIWPFTRSRSAGNNWSGRTRPGMQTNRKVSSAPCSRSNSSGDSKTRKTWASSSPGRTGLHLGRTSPVWHVKNKSGSGKKGRILKLNVPVCMGYRQSIMSCRTQQESGGNNNNNSNNGINGNSFSLRGLFSKRNNNNTVLTA